MRFTGKIKRLIVKLEVEKHRPFIVFFWATPNFRLLSNIIKMTQTKPSCKIKRAFQSNTRRITKVVFR